MTQFTKLAPISEVSGWSPAQLAKLGLEQELTVTKTRVDKSRLID